MAERMGEDRIINTRRAHSNRRGLSRYFSWCAINRDVDGYTISIPSADTMLLLPNCFNFLYRRSQHVWGRHRIPSYDLELQCDPLIQSSLPQAISPFRFKLNSSHRPNSA